MNFYKANSVTHFDQSEAFRAAHKQWSFNKTLYWTPNHPLFVLYYDRLPRGLMVSIFTLQWLAYKRGCKFEYHSGVTQQIFRPILCWNYWRVSHQTLMSRCWTWNGSQPWRNNEPWRNMNGSKMKCDWQSLLNVRVMLYYYWSMICFRCSQTLS